MGTVVIMKAICGLLAILPLLASSFKVVPSTPPKETYASYAQRNGIPLPKSGKASNQYANCYDYTNQQGNYYQATEYLPDLYKYGWDNRFSSCSVYGIWTLYQDSNYNSGNTNSIMFSTWGENYAVNLNGGNPNFDNQASSIRFVGAPDGYKYDTINLFQYKGYMGLEQYAYGDTSSFNYDNLGSSAIITGCSAWSVYQYDNYQGQCYCLYSGDSSNCYPGFYKDLGGISNQISSARKGCYCPSNKLVPDEIIQPRIGAGVVGGSSAYQN